MTHHRGFPPPDTDAWFADYLSECVDDPDDLAGIHAHYLTAHRGRSRRGQCDPTKPGPARQV